MNKVHSGRNGLVCSTDQNKKAYMLISLLFLVSG